MVTSLDKMRSGGSRTARQKGTSVYPKPRCCQAKEMVSMEIKKQKENKTKCSAFSNCLWTWSHTLPPLIYIELTIIMQPYLKHYSKGTTL